MPQNARILIINGHPRQGSLNWAFADAYQRAAQQSGFEVRRLDLAQMKFDPILNEGYHSIQTLEPDLVQAQQDILWSSHLVWIFPTWWVGEPALLRGFLDRAILPGFAFQYHKTDPWWDRLLRGRSARIITTMEAPYLYNLFMYRSDGHINFRRGVLGFCGIRPIRTTVFDRMRNRKPAEYEQMIRKVEALGRKGL